MYSQLTSDWRGGGSVSQQRHRLQVTVSECLWWVRWGAMMLEYYRYMNYFVASPSPPKLNQDVLINNYSASLSRPRFRLQAQALLMPLIRNSATLPPKKEKQLTCIFFFS